MYNEHTPIKMVLEMGRDYGYSTIWMNLMPELYTYNCKKWLILYVYMCYHDFLKIFNKPPTKYSKLHYCFPCEITATERWSWNTEEVAKAGLSNLTLKTHMDTRTIPQCASTIIWRKYLRVFWKTMKYIGPFRESLIY